MNSIDKINEEIKPIRRGRKLNKDEPKVWVLGNDYTKEYFKNYYSENGNKDALSKVTCECGRHYLKTNKTKHIYTSIHERYLKKKQLLKNSTN